MADDVQSHRLKLLCCKGSLKLLRQVLQDFGPQAEEFEKAFAVGDLARSVFRSSTDGHPNHHWFIQHLQYIHKNEKFLPVVVDDGLHNQVEGFILTHPAKIKIDSSKTKVVDFGPCWFVVKHKFINIDESDLDVGLLHQPRAGTNVDIAVTTPGVVIRLAQ